MELLNKTCINIIFQSQNDVWSDISRLCRDTDVNASDIHRIMKCGKSENTNKKYDLYFNKFKKWCEMHNVQYLPAPVSAVAVFSEQSCAISSFKCSVFIIFLQY